VVQFSKQAPMSMRIRGKTSFSGALLPERRFPVCRSRPPQSGIEVPGCSRRLQCSAPSRISIEPDRAPTTRPMTKSQKRCNAGQAPASVCCVSPECRLCFSGFPSADEPGPFKRCVGHIFPSVYLTPANAVPCLAWQKAVIHRFCEASRAVQDPRGM